MKSVEKLKKYIKSKNGGIQNSIHTVRTAEESDKVLEIYTKTELFKDEFPEGAPAVLNDTVAVAIRNLFPEVAEYNKKVTEEKTRFATENQNKADITAIQASLGEQKAELEKIKNAIASTEKPAYGEQKDYVATVVKGELFQVEATLSALEQQLAALNENEAIANGTEKVDKEKFETSISNFGNSLTGLKKSVNVASDDLKAWADFQTLSNTLLSTYNSGLKTLRALKSVNEKYSVVEDRAEKLEQTLTDLYNAAAKSFTIKADNPFGAKDALANDQEKAEKAISNIEMNVDMFVELVNGNPEAEPAVEGQNPLMEKYLGTLAEFNAKSAALQATIDKLDKTPAINALQSALDRVDNKAVLFKNAIDAAYNKLELDPTAPIVTLDGATVEAVNTAIISEIDKLQAQLKPIADLQKALVEAQSEIEKLAEKYIVNEDYRPVMVGKFDDTVENLRDAINALTIPVDDKNAIKVGDAIRNLTGQAENLFKAYNQAADLIADFELAVKNIEKLINNKLILTGSAEFKADFCKNNEGYLALLVKLNGSETEKGEKQLFADARAATGENCLTLFTSLVETCKAYDYASAAEAVAKSFDVAGTQMNLDALTLMKEHAEMALNNAKDCAGYAAIKALMNEASNARYKATLDFETAESATDYSSDEFARIDGECKNVQGLYDQILTDSVKYLSYLEYYTEDVNRLDAIEKAFGDYMQEWRNTADIILYVWEDRCDNLNMVLDALRETLNTTYEDNYADEETGYGSLVVRMSLDKQIEV